MKANRLNWVIPIAIVAVAALLLALSVFFKPAVQENEIIISVAGEEYRRIPLSQPQRVEIHQENGEVNVIDVTSVGARMESSTCKNQKCVHMGEVTLDNWETRPNQEYIICLPNQIVVQLAIAQQGVK